MSDTLLLELYRLVNDIDRRLDNPPRTGNLEFVRDVRDRLAPLVAATDRRLAAANRLCDQLEEWGLMPREAA